MLTEAACQILETDLFTDLYSTVYYFKTGLEWSIKERITLCAFICPYVNAERSSLELVINPLIM